MQTSTPTALEAAYDEAPRPFLTCTLCEDLWPGSCCPECKGEGTRTAQRLGRLRKAWARAAGRAS